MGPGSLGKTLVLLGAVLAGIGGLLLLGDRFPSLRLGRLPGDLSVERDGFRLYVPIATSVVISVVVSVVLWLVGRRG